VWVVHYQNPLPAIRPKEREQAIGELDKKNELLAAMLRYPILWDGHPTRLCIISKQNACTTREFGIFFYLEVSRQNSATHRG
jgi:hypothetical protein